MKKKGSVMIAEVCIDVEIKIQNKYFPKFCCRIYLVANKKIEAANICLEMLNELK